MAVIRRGRGRGGRADLFHQSALPLALLLRLAGLRRITASARTTRARVGRTAPVDDDLPEAERALSTVAAAGFARRPGDGRLRVRRPLPDVAHLTGPGPYVVLHPGASVPARAWSPHRCAAALRALTAAGYRVLVTGSPAEAALSRYVAGGPGGPAADLGGRTSLAELAAVLAGADAVVVGNTGPAHLAAAVGTPVVSLFAPVVPAACWAPYGVPCVLLGDQDAPCAETRRRSARSRAAPARRRGPGERGRRGGQAGDRVRVRTGTHGVEHRVRA